MQIVEMLFSSITSFWLYSVPFLLFVFLELYLFIHLKNSSKMVVIFCVCSVIISVFVQYSCFILRNNPCPSLPQWIKEKIAQTLKTLQKRYVTTDALVTSEDSEANQLCCSLEAVFIHGLRSKHVRTDGAGTRNRKGGSLPQPVFWNLLKTITHRQVICLLSRQHKSFQLFWSE